MAQYPPKYAPAGFIDTSVDEFLHSKQTDFAAGRLDQLLSTWLSVREARCSIPVPVNSYTV